VERLESREQGHDFLIYSCRLRMCTTIDPQSHIIWLLQLCSQQARRHLPVQLTSSRRGVTPLLVAAVPAAKAPISWNHVSATLTNTVGLQRPAKVVHLGILEMVSLPILSAFHPLIRQATRRFLPECRIFHMLDLPRSPLHLHPPLTVLLEQG
jgi:hypothetical protein